jgi:hypothetical protein
MFAFTLPPEDFTRIVCFEHAVLGKGRFPIHISTATSHAAVLFRAGYGSYIAEKMGDN